MGGVQDEVRVAAGGEGVGVDRWQRGLDVLDQDVGGAFLDLNADDRGLDDADGGVGSEAGGLGGGAEGEAEVGGEQGDEGLHFGTYGWDFVDACRCEGRGRFRYVRWRRGKTQDLTPGRTQDAGRTGGRIAGRTG